MRILFNIIFVALACPSGAQIMWQMDKDTVISWYYREGDEFNGDKLNTAYWEYTYGWARSIYGNKEQQYYSDGKNHKLQDGQLILTARKQEVIEKVIDWMADNDSIFDGNVFMGLNKRRFNYTAGMIQSRHEMLYGFFEIKFTMSPVKGYWPAFWLWGGTPNEEIDFFELKTEKKNKIHVGRHSQNRNENYLPYFLFKKKVWGDWVKFKGDLTRSYNVISGEWAPGYIKYYLNGESIAYTKVGLAVPKRLVANIAVPGNGPFKPGPPLKDSAAEFKIDYIRVWTHDSAGYNKIAQKPVVDSFPISRQLGCSSLRSKGKFLYGQKSIHQNEGILVSLMPALNNTYKLTVMGKVIPATASYTLYDQKGNMLRRVPLSYGESLIDLSPFQEREFQFVIAAFGKKSLTRLSVSDK